MSIASWWRWFGSGGNDERTGRLAGARGPAAGRTRHLPRLEVLDARIALSALPVGAGLVAGDSAHVSGGTDSATSAERITVARVRAVSAGAEHTVVTLARTNNVELSSARLTALASQIPDGLQQLAPVWQADVASADLQTPGSARALARQLLADLKQDIAAGVAAGEFRLVGPGAAAYLRTTLAAQPSRDSVTIANKTGFSITVSASLDGSGRSIPARTIANNGSLLFDFGSMTNDPITIQVRRPGSNQPPPATVLLSRPVSGYFGKQFTVSVFSGFFSVSQ